MKLIRFGELHQEMPGIFIDNTYYDLRNFGEDYNEAFFESNGLRRLEKYVSDNRSSLTPVSPGTRIGSPVARPSKIVCIGLNYADHAKETGAPIPPEPVIFMKSTTALCGPYDDVIIPKNSQKTDWEVELAIVIGRRASYVEESEAMDYVAGYCLHNDLSEREFQLERSGTWDKGKGCDTFAPLGPWLVTKEEIADPGNLKLWLSVNGKVMQNGSTSTFIFGIPHVISYVSHFMTLLPGDVISTGTPPGVGLGMTPPLYLREGDVMELGIDGLGSSRQKCIAYAPHR
ncbi:MAG: fumarylacetoacetate hydrolase family protein [Chitinophagaceae bacterium]|nr:fumarylacetoacetate hydrolase family protein [Chitinophagaceae bacterium]